MQTYRGICVNALSGLYLIVTNKASERKRCAVIVCQCPLGLIPHCYFLRFYKICWVFIRVNALSGLYLIVTDGIPRLYRSWSGSVSMPSRAYTSLLPVVNGHHHRWKRRVNALSGLYLIVTLCGSAVNSGLWGCVNALSGLYLIVTEQGANQCFNKVGRVNALSGLYLIVTMNSSSWSFI